MYAIPFRRARWPSTVGLVLCLACPVEAASGSEQAAASAPVVTEDPFARGAWSLDLAAQALVEAWNYNLSREELHGGHVGFMYGLRDGLAVGLTWPMLYVSQRTTDAYLIGALGIIRWRIAGGVRRAVVAETGVGVSGAELPVPPRGTRFNYLYVAGIAATARLPTGPHAIVGLRWMHLSNFSLAGRDRNPDIQAVGPYAGLLIPF